jgi:hypothetical protein
MDSRDTDGTPRISYVMCVEFQDIWPASGSGIDPKRKFDPKDSPANREYVASVPKKDKLGDKHHYIPKFYLKQWAVLDGKLCEFRKPYKTVVDRMTDPDGTGYVR